MAASAYPEKVPYLFAYNTHHCASDPHLREHGMAYRRQAANQRTLDWGVLDSGLYNDEFTRQATAIQRCFYCSADTHHPRDCPDSPGGKHGDVGVSGVLSGLSR